MNSNQKTSKNDKFYSKIISFSLMILLVGILYIIFYKPSITDPIESTKKLYLRVNFVAILIYSFVIFLSSLVFKDRKELIYHLKIILVYSTIVVLVLFVVKMRLDFTYTEDKFSEIYDTSNLSELDTNEYYVSIGLKGIKLTDHKSIFINENIKAYNYFKLKTTVGLTLYCALELLNVYLISKFSNREKASENLKKDDNVFFDKS